MKLSALCLLVLIGDAALGQARLRKMPANINHAPINNFAPYVSLDGNSMVFIADNAEDNALTMNYTSRDHEAFGLRLHSFADFAADLATGLTGTATSNFSR